MSFGVSLVPFCVPRVDLVYESSLVRYTVWKTLTTEMAEFDLRHVEPTAMFGSIMDVSFVGDSFRLMGIKCFVKRSFGVGIEIIHHQTDFLHMRRMLVNECL